MKNLIMLAGILGSFAFAQSSQAAPMTLNCTALVYSAGPYTMSVEISGLTKGDKVKASFSYLGKQWTREGTYAGLVADDLQGQFDLDDGSQLFVNVDLLNGKATKNLVESDMPASMGNQEGPGNPGYSMNYSCSTN